MQVQSKRDGFEVQHVSATPIPAEAIVDGALMNYSAVSQAVRSLAESGGVKAKKVTCSLSGNAVIAKVVTMPAMSPSEAEEQIHWEAGQHIPFSIDDVNLDYQILSKREGEMSVLLVAAKKDVLADYQNIVTEAGLQLAVVDVDALALFNCFYANHLLPNRLELEQALVGLVNVGASMTNIVIVRAGVPMFLRDVPTAGHGMTTEIQKGLGLSFDEAEAVKTGRSEVPEAQRARFEEVVRAALEGVVAEIQRTAEFYLGTAGEEGIQRYFVTGGATRTPHLLDVLRARMGGASVDPLNPFARAQVGAKYSKTTLDELSAVSAIGVGLALRQPQDAMTK